MMDEIFEGSMKKALVRFAFPYMIAAFLQTLYGLVDLFVVGLYHTAATTTAVSVGSQIMHMVTVIILGLVLGITVLVGNSTGAQDKEGVKKTIATGGIFFSLVAVIFTALMLIGNHGIVRLMMTPKEAVTETGEYLWICCLGIPFIFGFNMISGIFRGMGDSKRPMYAVIAACIANVILDFVFVGGFQMGAKGAALATVAGQIASTITVFCLYKKQNRNLAFKKTDYKIDKNVLSDMLKIGIPVACQDGFIQVAFIAITVIANSRGLVDAAAVGVVEKLIGFFFLIPSAFLSAISALTAQCMGAKRSDKAKECLKWGLIITVCWGLLIGIINQFIPHVFIGIFTKDTAVIAAGCTYLRSYAFDTVFAAMHFCFSGYFCGIQKSQYSFIHNVISVIFFRVPGAYITSKVFPNTLYPMGWAAPIGSLASAIICMWFYWRLQRKESIN